jgi:Oxidoreductase molybdopterin binding domain
MATRGFSGKSRPAGTNGRLPPGQFLTEDFPVLSAGPTPRISPEAWRFTLRAGPQPVKQWSWAEFDRLPLTTVTRDIHCVTRWSKFDTAWAGVSIDDLLADAGIEPPGSRPMPGVCYSALRRLPRRDSRPLEMCSMKQQPALPRFPLRHDAPWWESYFFTFQVVLRRGTSALRGASAGRSAAQPRWQAVPRTRGWAPALRWAWGASASGRLELGYRTQPSADLFLGQLQVIAGL